MAVEGGSMALALALPPRLSASSPPFVGMLLTGNPSKNLALGREEGKEDEGGGLLVRRRRRTSSPPVRRRAAAPSPAPCPVALPSASIRIGSGGWEVGIETGPEWAGRRPNRARFQSEPPKTNDDSGLELVSNRAISFRPDWRPFRAGFGATERGLRWV